MLISVCVLTNEKIVHQTAMRRRLEFYLGVRRDWLGVTQECHGEMTPVIFVTKKSYCYGKPLSKIS